MFTKQRYSNNSGQSNCWTEKAVEDVLIFIIGKVLVINIATQTTKNINYNNTSVTEQNSQRKNYMAMNDHNERQQQHQQKLKWYRKQPLSRNQRKSSLRMNDKDGIEYTACLN